MQNFTTKPPVAVRKAVIHSTGKYTLKAAEYAQLNELQDAWAHVEDAKRQAEAEAEELRAQYRAEGLSAGRAAAQQEAMDCMAQMKQSMDGWVKATDTQLIELVSRCVNEVVGEMDPSLIAKRSVEKGLAEFIDAQQINIRVHTNTPEFTETVEHFKRHYGMAGTVRILEDGTLGEGDVVVESPVGTVDLRVTNQLQLIEKALRP